MTRTGRLEGLDAARGLAVVGMMVAHTAVAGVHAGDVDGPAAWLATMSHGRSAMLFALCAGMSLAVLTGWPDPRGGEAAVHARLRVLARSCALLVVAAVLVALDTGVYVILGFYAAWFAVALPVARWSARRLLALAAVVALAGPPLAWGLVALGTIAGAPQPTDANAFLIQALVTGVYPGAVYLGAVLAGMAFVRADPRRGGTRAIALGAGLACAAVGYGIGNLVAPAVAPGLFPADPSVTYTEAYYLDPRYLLASFPHAATTPELLGSGGVAAVVVSLALGAPRGVLAALTPLRAVGALALTSYSLHLVVLWLVPGLIGTESVGASTAFVLGIVALCWAWWALLGKGPLERAVAAVADAAVRPPAAQSVQTQESRSPVSSGENAGPGGASSTTTT